MIMSASLKREIITPKNEQDWLEHRKKDLTSTEVSALFGLNNYVSEYELWHLKKNGTSSPFEETEWIKWGKRMEQVIAEGVADDNGFTISPLKDYIRIPDLKLGSSFDFSIDNYRDTPDNVKGLLEIKNVMIFAFKDNWIVDGDYIEAPPYIEIQTQHQLLVSGRAYAYICPFVGGNSPKLVYRLPDEDIHNEILERSAKFWKSVKEDIPPSPDYERDSKFISFLYSKADKGKIFFAENDANIATLAKEYKEQSEIAKEAESKKQGIKAQLLEMITDHDKVVGDGFSISAGVTEETVVPSFTRKAFRNFRIFFKK